MEVGSGKSLALIQTGEKRMHQRSKTAEPGLYESSATLPSL